MGATARMQYHELRVNHRFSDFEDPAERSGVLYGNEVRSESAQAGESLRERGATLSAEAAVRYVAPRRRRTKSASPRLRLEILRNELTSSRSRKSSGPHVDLGCESLLRIAGLALS
jgi:hypothetical protein